MHNKISESAIFTNKQSYHMNVLHVFAFPFIFHFHLSEHKFWYSVKVQHKDTVNVVIFAGGKFRENVGKTFHMG